MTSTSPAPDATESAVVIPVPEAEAAVGPHRGRLDPFAAWGVPAHVTVLAPFVPPHAITDSVIEALGAAVASAAAFDCEFSGTRWFGDRVLWLAPEPAQPFRALTSSVSAAFPGFLPYQGIHDEVVPHLTIGYREAGGSGLLRAAEASVRGALPVRTRVRCAWLMTGRNAPGGWRMVAELPLAADRDHPPGQPAVAAGGREDRPEPGEADQGPGRPGCRAVRGGLVMQRAGAAAPGLAWPGQSGCLR